MRICPSPFALAQSPSPLSAAHLLPGFLPSRLIDARLNEPSVINSSYISFLSSSSAWQNLRPGCCSCTPTRDRESVSLLGRCLLGSSAESKDGVERMDRGFSGWETQGPAKAAASTLPTSVSARAAVYSWWWSMPRCHRWRFELPTAFRNCHIRHAQATARCHAGGREKQQRYRRVKGHNGRSPNSMTL